MKRIKSTIISCAVVAAGCLLHTSCDLDLTPIDHYGSESYWKTEAHIIGYMDGLHKNMRDKNTQHQSVFGEVRGGAFIEGTTVSGSSAINGSLKGQLLSSSTTGVTKWGELYGLLANVNLFIQRTLEANYMDAEKKKHYLGQAYGLRAFYYFDLYRIYGSCPLQLEAKVVNGVIDPNLLYTERSSAATVMAQIKSDLDESLEYFGDDKEMRGQKSYWSKAATECLMGEVYLWTSKVSTGDDKADLANLTIAKKHLLNVMNDYGFKLLPNFADIYDATPAKKGHDEVIMAVRYMDGEAVNDDRINYLYNWGTSNFKDAWLFENGKVTSIDTLKINDKGWHRHEYKEGLFRAFDKDDSRRDATFLTVYNKGDKSYAGSYMVKNIGYYNLSMNKRVYSSDEILYRLPWVYLTLAEIENMQGGDPAKYINMVRERAYASKWDAGTYGYSNSDFTANELAILKEKDKEFVGEGQRWWDVRRMTLTKGGKHLVFCAEGNIDSTEPILKESTEAYKVLWPIEVEMLNKDPELVQTPGY